MLQKYLGRGLPCLSALACCTALLSYQPPVQAQQPASVPQPETALKLEPPHDEWEQDAALKTKLSLEVKRMPLDDLLAEVRKQSGVKISPQEGAPVRSLVTARLSEMTVLDFMRALSRTYDVRWSKQGDGYLMHPTEKDEFTFRMSRLGGESEKSETTQDLREREQREDALAQEIFYSVDEELWKSPEGVAVTSLPEDVQQKLYEMYKDQADQGYIREESLKRQMAGRKYVLRLHIPELDKESKLPTLIYDSGVDGDLRLAAEAKSAGIFVYTTDGAYAVSKIFRFFEGPRVFPTFPGGERDANAANAPAAQ